MCVTSMIGDHYSDKFTNGYYWGQPQLGPSFTVNLPAVTKEEFEALKKDVLEMKELLKLAIKYDKEHNQPECYDEEKWAVIRTVANAVGVDIDDVLDKACKYNEFAKNLKGE